MSELGISNHLQGIAASPGIGIGKAVWKQRQRTAVPRHAVSMGEVEHEVARLNQAIFAAKGQLEQLRVAAAQQMGEKEAQIFDAHLAFLDDPAYTGAMQEQINSAKMNAEAVCDDVTEELRMMLASLPDEYLRARADDIRDVGDRLLQLLSGNASLAHATVVAGDVIVADELSPSDLAALPKTLAGIVTARGSTTGHVAIMARTLGIPAVLGLQESVEAICDGDLLILDGDQGVVTVRPDDATVTAMQTALKKQRAAHEGAVREAGALAQTADGMRIQTFANIGKLGDVQAALENGAEGIGLFRTEFLYIDNPHWPTEDEQFQAYKKVLESFGERPVIIRTLDIGGDKELPYAQLPKEENPFLGLRAIRFCLSQPSIFRVQLRALLRASAYGTLWIMIPMVSGIDEVRQAKEMLQQCRTELKHEGVSMAAHIEVGIMVETPAAAVMADVLAKEVDFMSIGTNDLTQYTLAADRGNEQVANLYYAYHPAVLRLIGMVCEAAKNAHIPVGVCGELAGDPRFTEVLIGLGVTELSMGSRTIPHVKQRIRSVTAESSPTIAAQVLKQESAQAVERLLL